MRLTVALIALVQSWLISQLVCAQHVSLLCEFEKDQQVQCLDFSPDNKTLVAGYRDGRITLWDVATRSIKQTSPRGQHGIYQVTYSPDGTLVAAVDSSEAIGIWDSSLQRTNHRLTQSKVQCVKFRYDGKKILIGRWGGSLDIVDLSSGKAEATFLDAVTTQSIDWSPDGKLIACGRSGDAVVVFDATLKTEVFTLERHAKFFPPVAFSQDSRTLAVGGLDEVLVIDLARPNDRRPFHGDLHVVSQVAFSPSGKHLAAIDAESTTFWDLTTGRVIDTIANQQKKHVVQVSMVFSHDGKHLAMTRCDGITLWKLP